MAEYSGFPTFYMALFIWPFFFWGAVRVNQIASPILHHFSQQSLHENLSSFQILFWLLLNFGTFALIFGYLTCKVLKYLRVWFFVAFCSNSFHTVICRALFRYPPVGRAYRLQRVIPFQFAAACESLWSWMVSQLSLWTLSDWKKTLSWCEEEIDSVLSN